MVISVYVSVEDASEDFSSLGALEEWPQEVRGTHKAKDNIKAKRLKEKLLF